MKHILVMLATVSLWLLAPSSASADTLWSMNASSCRPNNDLIGSSGGTYVTLYATAAGRIQDTSESYTSTFYCPISHYPGASMSVLGLTAVADFYALSDAKVTAQLVRINVNTGSLSNVGSAVTATNLTTFRWTVSVSHTFDYNNYFYYVRVDVSRAFRTAKFYGVDISS